VILNSPIRMAQAAGRRREGVRESPLGLISDRDSRSNSSTVALDTGCDPRNSEKLAISIQVSDTIRSQEQCVNGRKSEPLARRRYQQGVLELRGNTYTVRFREDVIQPDGRTRRVETRRVVGSRAEFPTRKLARRRADEIVAHVNHINYKPIRVATFEEFADVWKSRALALMKPSTQKAAQTHLRNYLVPQFGKMRLDEFGAGPVQVLVAEMAANGRSRHYVKNVLSTLQSMIRSARSWGYLVGELRTGDLTLPGERIRKAPRFFTADQATAIIDAAKNPWRMIFALAAMTGMRPGEVLGLAVDDLDFEGRLIHVRQTAYYSKLQTPKSRSSIAAVPMPSPLEGMLREYLKTWKPNAARLLFATRKGTPFAENNLVQRKLWPILDALKISRCGMHAFRHTHASLLIAQGASPAVAQRQLRHRDVGTTLGIYAHVLGNEQREASERVAGQLRPDATKATKISSQVAWVQ
jgi:integrase